MTIPYHSGFATINANGNYSDWSFTGASAAASVSTYGSEVDYIYTSSSGQTHTFSFLNYALTNQVCIGVEFIVQYSGGEIQLIVERLSEPGLELSHFKRGSNYGSSETTQTVSVFLPDDDV